MKNQIHIYRGQRINGVQVKIKDLIKLKPKDQIIFDKFIERVSGSAGEKRVKKVSRELLVIHDTAEVGLGDWDEDVLDSFLVVLNKTKLAKYTSNDYKKTLKAFLKSQYTDWNIRFKELNQKGLKQVSDPVNREKINKQTLLKPNEFELLVKGCDKPIMRVYVHLAYKSAGRPEELLKLKFKDIDLDTGELSLFSSKTQKPRVIFVDEDCKNDILNYKENQYGYPNPTDEDYIFVSPVKRNVPVSTPTIYCNLKTVAKSKIGRVDITPYLFRHTRLSFMIKKLSPKQYEQFAGHSLEVGMKFYAHVDTDDLREELFAKVFDKVELPKNERDKLEKKIDDLKSIVEKQNKKYDSTLTHLGTYITEKLGVSEEQLEADADELEEEAIRLEKKLATKHPQKATN